MPADSSPEHLAELHRRWQAEPGSRLFLQLAEEYRRAHRHGEAVEVLEAGLESHPNHVSAHVALGRARLEMGEPGPAIVSLERALALDATNLVANKLLIEAHLARGERERARQRLELYGLLNDGDPDIADLRRRIAGRDEAPAERPAPPPAGQVGDGDSTLDEVLAEGLSWGGEATGESLAPVPAGGGVVEEGSTEDVAPADDGGWENALGEEPMTTRNAQSTDARQSEAAAGTTPSAEAAAGSAEPFGDLAADGAERRYLQGLAEDGLFEVPGVATAPAEATEQAPAASRSEEAEAAAPPPTPVAMPGGEDDRPTVTLGQLYLDQGHFAQARRVFGALLDEEPEHPVALRGLERAERGLAETGPGTLTAADLLQEAEPGQPARRAMLGAYLARILRPRESRASDVPR